MSRATADALDALQQITARILADTQKEIAKQDAMIDKLRAIVRGPLLSVSK